jgi:hypothetical protein
MIWVRIFVVSVPLALLTACAIARDEAFHCLQEIPLDSDRSSEASEFSHVLQWPIGCEDKELKQPDSYSQFLHWLWRGISPDLHESIAQGASSDFGDDNYYLQNYLIDLLIGHVGINATEMSWCRIGEPFYAGPEPERSCAYDGWILLVERLRGNYNHPEEIIGEWYAYEADLLVERSPPASCAIEDNGLRVWGVEVFWEGRLRYMSVLTGCNDQVYFSDSETDWVSSEQIVSCVVVRGFGTPEAVAAWPVGLRILSSRCRVALKPPRAISYDYLKPEWDRERSGLQRIRIIN